MAFTFGPPGEQVIFFLNKSAGGQTNYCHSFSYVHILQLFIPEKNIAIVNMKNQQSEFSLQAYQQMRQAVPDTTSHAILPSNQIPHGK